MEKHFKGDVVSIIGGNALSHSLSNEKKELWLYMVITHFLEWDAQHLLFIRACLAIQKHPSAAVFF